MSLLGPRKAGRGRGGVSHHPLLIRTKLEPPARTGRSLSRDRLFDFLANPHGWKFVAVHAPAGYGKSAFLHELKLRLDDQGWNTGWIRLDREDNEPERLLRYIEAALQQAGVLDAPEDQAFATGSEPVALVLERLCARISTIEQDAALIFDHAHELDSKPAWHCLETILRYVPEKLRICIGSRAPDFPGLGRLRGDAGLVEIDSAQLAFDEEESQQFLEMFEQPALPVAALRPFHKVTMGWPLGLQMLAMHLAEVEDPETELNLAGGGHGPFPDYFRQEIFDRLTPTQRRLVLLIGVVEAGPAELVTELRGATVLPAEIEELISAGMFLSRDPRPGWYRMHPMLAQFTAVEWTEQDPEGFSQCHERAALWFGARNEVQSAVQHSVRAGNKQLALGFINQCLESCIDQARFRQISDWRGIFPESDLHRYPVLVVMMAWELGSQGRWLDAEVLASGVIGALVRKSRRKRQDTRDNEVRRSIGLRACAGMISGNDALLEEASTQWRNSDDGKPGETGLAMVALAQACLQQGNRERMEERLQQAGNLQAKHASSLVGTLNDWVRCQAALESGDLERAARLAAMSGALIETAEIRRWSGGLMDLIAATVDFERGHTEVPTELLQNLVRTEAPLFPALARTEAARILARHLFQDQGLTAGREILHTAREQLPDLPDSACRTRLDAEELRLLLRDDRIEDAKRILRSRGWDKLARTRASGFDPVYCEIAEITARLALATGKPSDALQLLGELQVMTPDWMACRKARHLALEVIATHAAGQQEAAMDMLRSLLSESAKVGLIQLFLEEGAQMDSMVRSLFPARQIETMEQGIYVNQLLKAFQAVARSAGDEAPAQPTPVEGLTERETEVLRMVAAGCSNSDISKQLYLSLGTVKWHLHNVYDKLMVRNRTQAVNRARELNWM